jgi:hypothetical protein
MASIRQTFVTDLRGARNAFGSTAWKVALVVFLLTAGRWLSVQVPFASAVASGAVVGVTKGVVAGLALKGRGL